MKAILAIAHAEILRSWKLIAVPLAAVIGVLALAAMGTQAADRTFRGNLMGILILFEFPLAAVPAAVLGLNLFAPDIRQRKLSFYLTRPCAPWQLWFGRLLGASLITSVGWFGGAVVLPFMGAPGSVRGGGIVRSVDAFIFAAVLAGLLLFMNALVMILAANAARWFVADVVVGLGFFVALLWSLGQTLQLSDPRYVAYMLGVGVVVALFFSGLAFLSFGRGDGASGHRAHSLTLWSFGAVAILGLGALRAYEWSRPIGSLLISGWASSVGPTKALVSTYGPRYGASFVIDTQTGAARRVSRFAAFAGAEDLKSGLRGHVEARLDPFASGFFAQHLVISSSDPDAPPLVDRQIPEHLRWLIDISEGGTLAMFGVANGVEVIRTQTGATVFRYSAPDVRWAAFQDDRTIVALVKESPSVARLSFLAPDGKVIKERKFPISTANWWYGKLHFDSGRLAIAEGSQGVTLYENDGTVVAHFAPEPPGSSQNPPLGGPSISPLSLLFTREGDFIRADSLGLSVVRRGETTVRHVPLTSQGEAVPSGRGRSISGQLASGDIVVSERGVSSEVFAARNDGSILLVDPRTGNVSVRLKNHRVLSYGGFQGFIGSSSPSADSSLRLFENDEGDIVFLDPGSARPRLLVKSMRKASS